MVKKERLPYIDVAKGVLILMVVWGHYELMLRLCFNVSDPVISRLDLAEDLWVSFFMPSFFFITGFCSSFSKPFRQFVWNTFRVILLPAVIISYSIFFVKYLYWDYGIEWVIKTMIKNFLLEGTNEWFLTSLFLSRLAVWGIVRIKRTGVQLAVVLLSLFAGVALYNYCGFIFEIWSFKHTLMMIIFLWAGVKSKGVKNFSPLLSAVYPILLCVLMIFHVSIPYITNRVDVPLPLTPLLLVLALSGVIMVLQISKWIHSNAILQYLGRNSMIIYLVHFTFYEFYMSFVIEYFNRSQLLSLLLFFGVIVADVVSCCIVARLLNTRYLRWIVGK